MLHLDMLLTDPLASNVSSDSQLIIRTRFDFNLLKKGGAWSSFNLPNELVHGKVICRVLPGILWELTLSWK